MHPETKLAWSSGGKLGLKKQQSHIRTLLRDAVSESSKNTAFVQGKHMALRTWISLTVINIRHLPI